MNFRSIPTLRLAGCAVLALFLSHFPARAARGTDTFDAVIRTTDPLTPAEEQKTFHLPPGFEIQLVTSEPAIGKPMNMNFDAQGRLWITQSREYPFPVPTNAPGRDAIKIISGFQPNGCATNVTTFATNLNIPIGLIPYKDGVLGFSIPYIYYFADTNHDGQADTREIVLGTFGFDRDTHGLTSAFRRGYDGWIYADHGFNNNTILTAKDGSTITMNSGNCYRFKPDGSHVEQHSWGQVNPFGLMFDTFGDLWSADCHSKPVYILQRGAHYPSFGKPHDGLGFAPEVVSHLHGSTAIAGIVYYAATNFPAEYQGNTFIGNVMTCRINRDSYVEHGSTRPGKEEPDFLSCDDPWFRPVDIQLGPDGAIYVADFYNRIIGHYEVPLDHPGRDRERGRIWRIVYTGKGVTSGAITANKPAKLENYDLSKSSATDLTRTLGHPNITLRMLAMNQLVDRIGQPAIKPVAKMMRDKKSNAFQKIHGLWVLQRLNALDYKILAAAAKDSDRGVRTHAMHILSEIEKLTSDQHNLLLAGLRDSDGFVQRAAADALGRHPQFENVHPLLDELARVPADDVQLHYATRMSLRNQFRGTDSFSRIVSGNFTEAGERAIADISTAVESPASAQFLLNFIQKYSEPRETLSAHLKHIVRYLPASDLPTLANVAEKSFGDDLDFQVSIFKSVQEGAAQRGGALPDNVREWASRLAAKLANSIEDASTWINLPIEGMGPTPSPWFVQPRPSTDGNKNSLFLCSLPPGGEQLTGILRSKVFNIPAKLSFFVAGHDGPPGKPAQKKNFIRLRAADTGELLQEANPPRNDTAHPYDWDLSQFAGRQGYLELVDGDNGDAYAWLAAGRFKPAVVKMPELDPRRTAERQRIAAEIARNLKITALAPQLTKWLTNRTTDVDARELSARALLSWEPVAPLALAGRILNDATELMPVREKMAEVLSQQNSAPARNALLDALRNAPERLQIRLAMALASSPDGAEALFRLVSEKKASARLIMERKVKERLTATKVPNLNDRLTQLTKGLSPLDEKIQQLIDKRYAGYNLTKVSVATGATIFVKNCAVCHSIDGKGALVGPQLDGVGGRGLERIMEDVLDPNRNVDPSFRYSTVNLKDGQSISGLQRREEGQVIVFVDATGKEISVAKKDIESRTESESSLMPDNFSEMIPIEDFNNLMAYLISHGSKK
ncbi:MAG: Cytochrome c [Pedosphaera sp.]|nr:Cytochrome c [Pedosphaera sp.]